MGKIKVKCLPPLFFCLILCYPVHPQEQQQGIAAPELEKILKETGEYCERLKDMALDFVCEEKIAEKTYQFGKALVFKPGAIRRRNSSFFEDLKTVKSRKNSYVYDYQMIKKGDDFKEKRDFLEENGKKRKEKNVELKTLRMSSKFLVFGPVGFLSKTWQPHFVYEIIGSETIGQKKAFVLKASPKELTEENHCFGKIWVDETDSSILQIEWEPASIKNFEERVESSIGELRREVSWMVSYDVVKNGIRFPSAQLIKETYITKQGKEHIKYEAEYKYENYKFFTVETEVVFK
jgi:hypothetical protein